MNEKEDIKKCLSHPEEYLASLILTKEFGLQGLIKSESPDWHTDMIGIEVVTAYPYSFNKGNGDYCGYLKHRDKNPQKADECFKKSTSGEMNYIWGKACNGLIKTNLKNDKVIQTRYMDFTGDFFKRDILLIEDAIKTKEESAIKYTKYPEMRLFCFVLGGFAQDKRLLLGDSVLRMIANSIYSVVYVHELSTWTTYEIDKETHKVNIVLGEDASYYNSELKHFVN